jgi:hypothetical protein
VPRSGCGRQRFYVPADCPASRDQVAARGPATPGAPPQHQPYPARLRARFFEGLDVTIEKTSNRARRKRGSALGFEHLGELNQGHIRPGLDRAHDRLMMLFNAHGAPVVALPLSLVAPLSRHSLTKCTRSQPRSQTVPLPPDATFPPQPHRSLWSAKSADNGLGRTCWPPCPARSENQNLRPLRILRVL